jgi:hypothetical protein
LNNSQRRTNWLALANWLKGIYELVTAYPYLAHLYPLRVRSFMELTGKISRCDQKLEKEGLKEYF